MNKLNRKGCGCGKPKPTPPPIKLPNNN